MTTFIIIIGLISSLIIYFFISNKIETRKYKKELNEILLEHRKIGYPRIDKNTQMIIIATSDTSPISKLIPESKSNWIPIELVEKYITVSKTEFKEYLKSSNALEKYKIENAPNPKHDGIWISGNKIIDQERGITHRTWNIKSEIEIIDVYVDLLWNRMNLK